jgi:hypothetical protein
MVMNGVSVASAFIPRTMRWRWSGMKQYAQTSNAYRAALARISKRTKSISPAAVK